MKHHTSSITRRDLEVRIPSADAVLAGTLLVPSSGLWHPAPAVLLVTGSGANDRDETVCGHTPFRVIAEHFAGCGYAVLRCDDRGVGESTGDANQQDFHGAVADVVAAYRWLARQPSVDDKRVAILGHSEGGLVAAAAAPQSGAAAVVMLAGPSIPIEPLLHEQARTLSVEAGASAAQIEHERQMNEQVFALARSELPHATLQVELEKVIGVFLRSWPEAKKFDDAVVIENARIMAGVINHPAYRSLLRQQPELILASTGKPILAVYGVKDTQVSGVANASAFREITAGLPNARTMLFEDHNHLFQVARTGAISEYESLSAGPDVVVLRSVERWLSSVLRCDE